ncbi:hypothetical protein NLU03_35035 [Bacillus toyonensis]|nr:hypothetical protein [Bacillus toyonensis]
MERNRQNKLILIICPNCDRKLCEALPGASVKCPKCKKWTTAQPEPPKPAA